MLSLKCSHFWYFPEFCSFCDNEDDNKNKTPAGASSKRGMPAFPLKQKQHQRKLKQQQHHHQQHHQQQKRKRQFNNNNNDRFGHIILEASQKLNQVTTFGFLVLGYLVLGYLALGT